MDFQLGTEQVQLEDSVSRLLAEHYGFEARQLHTRSDRGFSAEVWSKFAQLGLLAIATPAEHGGFDGGTADLLVVARAFGRALVVEPFLASAVMAATALRYAQPNAIKHRLLTDMAEGRHVAAFAHHRGTNPGLGIMQATLSGGVWTLSGRVQGVLNGDAADSFVLAATVADGRRRASSTSSSLTDANHVGSRDAGELIGLFWIDGGEPGLVRRSYSLIDQRRAADLSFSEARVTPLIEPSAEAASAACGALDVGTAVICADAAGAMRGAFDMTTAYLGTRRQFGRPLAENQVLRHRAADMLVAVETVEAMAYLAAVAVDHPDSVDPARDLARAKLLAGRYGRWLGEQAVQLHGGIGMTDEYAVGHYLQRLTVNDHLLAGDDDLLDMLVGHRVSQ